MNSRSQKGIWLTVVLSLVSHAAILFFYTPLANDLKEIKEKDLIEITDYRDYLKKTGAQKVPNPITKIPDSQIAETEKADNNLTDPRATFLGAQNQMVEKQTRAQQIDDFRSKQGTGAKGIPTTTEMIPPTSADMGREELLSEDGVSLTEAPKKMGVKRNWKTLSLKDLSVGGDGSFSAATDDKLNVDRGEQTLLATREYKFFGYYQRIKELLRQYWKPNIEHQMARIWGKGKQINEDELVTRVLVLLDENGGITKISKLASSGYLELDEAAVQAFQSAGPFPNPPKAMLDEDGLVRINWDFILTTDNGPRIQFRNVGSVPPP
ncbi:MAG: energy transducer TonB [Bdellovibrionales bacterium]|nr:energy transducer TonB [Bdellovibrionales bacterium]